MKVSSYGYTLILRFVAMWTSCLLTPIVACIQQVARWGDSMVIICFLCDLVMLYCNCRPLQQLRSKLNIDRFSTASIPTILKGLALFSLPISCGYEVQGMYLLFICSLRLVYFLDILPLMKLARSHFSSTKVIVFSDTSARVISIFILGALQISLWACVWFYTACRFSFIDSDGRADGLTADERNDSLAAHCGPQSWVAFDSYIHLSDNYSRYLRAAHFITQVSESQ